MASHGAGRILGRGVHTPRVEQTKSRAREAAQQTRSADRDLGSMVFTNEVE